jgi:hypothetical protein
MLPGMKGALVAKLVNHVEDSANDQAKILRDLRQRLFDANKRDVMRQSAKEALATLQGEILDEVAGRKAVRLSDPNNTELRNSFYVDEMARRVESNGAAVPDSPSGESVKLSKEAIAEFKSRCQIK